MENIITKGLHAESGNKLASDKVVRTNSIILSYNETTGSFAAYDSSCNNKLICKYVFKLKPTQSIHLVGASRSEDNMFFIVLKGEFTVYGMMVFNNTIVVGKPVKLDQSFLDFADKKKMNVKSISCHPNNPYLFVEWNNGRIHVWGYRNLTKALTALCGGSDHNNEVESDDDEQIGVEVSDSVSESNHSASGATGAGTSSGMKSFLTGKRTPVVAMLIARSSFLCPPNVIGFLQHQVSSVNSVVASVSSASLTAAGPSSQPTTAPNSSSFRPTVTSFVIDPLGRFAAICWNCSLICLYSITPRSLAASNTTTTPNGITQIRSIATSMAFPSSWSIAPGSGSICFHPTEPILLVLSRKSNGDVESQQGGLMRNFTITIHSLLETGIRIFANQSCHTLLSNCLKNHAVGANTLSMERDYYPHGLFSQAGAGNNFQMTFRSISNTRELSPISIDLALSPRYLQKYCCPSGGVNSVECPASSFLDGSLPTSNRIVQFRATTNTLSIGRRPVNYTYVLHQVPLVASSGAPSSSQKTLTATNLGVLPTVATRATINNALWYEQHHEDMLPYDETYFIAQHIVPVPVQLGYSPANPPPHHQLNEVEVMVKGIVIHPKVEVAQLTTAQPPPASDKQETLKERKLSYLLDVIPCVGFLRCFPDGSLENFGGGVRGPSIDIVWSSYRDVCYWIGPTNAPEKSKLNDSVETDNVQHHSQQQFRPLALSSTGRKIKWLAPLNESLLATQTWELPMAMQSVSSPPLGCVNRLLYSTEAGNSPNSPLQLLVLSNLNSPALPLSPISFELHSNEVLLEIKWQPVPDSFVRKDNEKLALDGLLWHHPPRTSQDNADKEFHSMIAVRTSHRILIFSNSLVLLNQSFHRNFAASDCNEKEARHQHRPSSGSRTSRQPDDFALSITWAGLAVVYTTESGGVLFLLPSEVNPTRIGNDTSISVLSTDSLAWKRSLGLSGSVSCGRLCSLPRQWTALDSTTSIVGVLSDRLLLGIVMPNIGFVVATRPLLPVEPFLMGMLLQNPSNGREDVKKPLEISSQAALQSTSAPVTISMLRTSPEFVKAWSSSIIQLVGSYFPMVITDSNASAGGAAQPTAHATARLCFTLANYFLSSSSLLDDLTGQSALEKDQLRATVEIVAGISSNPSDKCRSDFEIRRWISPGIKFDIERRCWQQRNKDKIGKGGTAEISNSIASAFYSKQQRLLELICDKDAYGGSALPNPGSILSKQAGFAAHLLSNGSEESSAITECRRLLADVAGDDMLVASILVRAGLTAFQKDGKFLFISDLLALKNSLEGRNPGLTEALDAFISSHRAFDSKPADKESKKLAFIATCEKFISVLEAPVSPTSITVNAKSLNECGRRTNLQVLTQDLSKQIPGSKDTGLTLMEETQRKCSGSLGPSRGATAAVLAMDLIEDFVGGRVIPEVAQPAGENSLRIGVTGGQGKFTQSTSLGESRGEGGETWSSDYTQSWVDGVGHGKEWDKIVGYWRFSDSVLPNEEDFISTGLPGAAIVFSDLSKYGGRGLGLELFSQGSSSTGYVLLPSSSSVDPGDSHDKVKSLYDLCYRGDSAASSEPEDFHSFKINPVRGLRMPIGRGGPLDIGMFHNDSERCRMTLELFVNSGNFVEGNGISQVLMQRITGPPPGAETVDHKGDPVNAVGLWCWYIDSDGSLCWCFGDPKLANQDSCLKTEPGVVAFGPGNDWKHLAVVIDSTASSPQVAGGKSTWEGINSTVTLYCNGQAVAVNTLTIPSVSEASMSLSTLFVVPNLRKEWMITELRIWSAIRGAMDIDSQRDNHLALASKRKRLQFRIRGGKKLFSPLSEFYGNGEEEIALNFLESPRTNVTPLATIFDRIAGKDELEESNAKASVDKEATTGPAGSAGSGHLAIPAAKLGASRRGSLLPPTSSMASKASHPSTPSVRTPSDAESGHGTTGEVETPVGAEKTPPAPSPTTGLSAAAMSRRASTGGTATMGLGLGLKPAPLSGGLAPPVAGATRSHPRRSSVVETNKPFHTDNNEATGLAVAKGSDSVPSVTTSAADASASTVESAGDKAAAIPSAVVSAAPAVSAQSSVTPDITVPSTSTSAAVHSNAPVSPPFRPADGPRYRCIPSTPHSPLVPVETTITTICKPLNQPNTITSWKSNPTSNSPLTRITVSPLVHSLPCSIQIDVPVAADHVFSVMVNNFQHRVGGVTTVPLLAVYSTNLISIYTFHYSSENTSSVTWEPLKLLVSQAMPNPLVFWSFMGIDSLVLISQTAAYSWKINTKLSLEQPSQPPQPQTRPAKIFDRIDDHGSALVSEVAFSEGWVMLTSTLTTTAQTFVSLHNLRTGRAGKFVASAGCFRPGGLVFLVASDGTHDVSNGGNIHLFSLEKVKWSTDPASQRTEILAIPEASWSTSVLPSLTSSSSSTSTTTKLPPTPTSTVSLISHISNLGEYVFFVNNEFHSNKMVLLQATTGDILLVQDLPFNPNLEPYVSIVFDTQSQSPNLVFLSRHFKVDRLELGPLVKIAKGKAKIN